MVPRNVLLIDESSNLLNACQAVLNGQSHPISVLDSRHGGILLQRKEVQVTVFSSGKSDAEALELLTKLKERFPSSSFVLAARHPTSDFIISAFRSGIHNVIKAPAEPADLFATICQCCNLEQTTGEMVFNLYHTKDISTITPVEEPSSGFSRKGVASMLRRALSAPRRMISGVRAHGKEEHQDATTAETGPGTRIPANSIVSESLGLFAGNLPEKREGGNPDSSRLSAFFFGTFNIISNGERIDKWPSRKARQLFAYMLINRKRGVSRDVLMERFWPHSQPESSRNCLNVAMHSIRQTLRRTDATRDHILFKDESYYINPGVDIHVDVEEFMQHWQRARSKGEARIHVPEIIAELESARKLYRGDFMEEEPYDEWASMERDNLREMYLAVLDRLSENYVWIKQYSSAGRLCEEILSVDTCREDVHRRLMLCYYRMGKRNQALKQFNKCSKALKTELEVEPTNLTRQLHDEIRADRVTSAAFL